MNNNPQMTSILDRLELATTELHNAAKAVIEFARSQSASLGDDDQWTRLPSAKKGAKCPVSGVSRGEINRLAAAGTVRKKTKGRMAFYSAADWRKHLSEQTASASESLPQTHATP